MNVSRLFTSNADSQSFAISRSYGCLTWQPNRRVVPDRLVGVGRLGRVEGHLDGASIATNWSTMVAATHVVLSMQVLG